MATTTPNNGWAVPTSTDYVAQGAVAIETLGDAIDASVGTGLLAWTAYTPTFGGFTVGNAASTFKYAKLGKTVHVRGLSILGTTSTMTGPLDIGLPFNSTGYTTVGTLPVGNASFHNGVSTYNYGFLVSLGSASSFRCQVTNASTTYGTGTDVSSGSSIPFAWTPPSAKFFACAFTYEAA
jgi:hypothetical protein